MNCMKCGREVQSEQAFCESCMTAMQDYPVRADVAVQLPVRKNTPAAKGQNPRRRIAPSEQEQIRRLKLRVRRLWTALALVLVVLVILACFTANHLLRDRRPQRGQNYSTAPKTEMVTE